MAQTKIENSQRTKVSSPRSLPRVEEKRVFLKSTFMPKLSNNLKTIKKIEGDAPISSMKFAKTTQMSKSTGLNMSEFGMTEVR